MGYCFQAGEEGEAAPLLSAKLHKSWIADVQLLPAAPFGEQEQKTDYGSELVRLPQLLTASNDGSVSLWDLSKCCDGRPLEAAHTDTLHTGWQPRPVCHAGHAPTIKPSCVLYGCVGLLCVCLLLASCWTSMEACLGHNVTSRGMTMLTACRH